jgi:transcription elongation factor Elf1
VAKSITRERAERIVRAHACENCGEYSYKRLVVKRADEAQREVGAIWQAVKVCGVCGHQQELGLDAEGDIVYAS